MRKEFAQHILDKVRDDYNHIAPDFANTRVNIWPEIAVLFDYIKKGDKVLDLGCGNGRFVNIIKEKAGPPASLRESIAGGQYFGTDVSKGLINIAKKNYPVENFQTTQALKLPFSDNYFDIIYSIAVLHHIPSNDFRLEFLQEARRVLKSGGIFVLTVWKPKDKQEKGLRVKFLLKKIFNLSRGLDFGDVIEPWFGNNKGERYFHCFTEVELTRLLRQVGFEILKSGIIQNEKGNRQNLFAVLKKLS
ncbi:MAG: class I SAM-dependent methyltransferase [bacterium]|nr:class I SAM-dependent methyltransferase [bacterium]